MRTFAQKQNQPQKPVSFSLARPNIATSGPDHRKHPILNLQGAIGNQAVQRMLQTNAEERKAGLTRTASPRFGHNVNRNPIHPLAAGAIQTKLAINKPGDEYEQAADHLSAQVMHMPEPRLQRVCACGGACPKCQMEEPGHGHEPLHTKRVESGNRGQTEVPPIIHEVLRSPGQPIDPTTRAFMEPRFGHDFSHVRVHAGESAEMSARTINAHAYTVGSDIVFGSGRFNFKATDGRRLLAHELTHVVQQSAGHAPRVVARQPADTEKEKPKVPPKAPKCDTGCAQRWGQDTTCSKWGFRVGEHEHAPHYVVQGEGKRMKFVPCCNSWPFSLEAFARDHLNLNGAASCPVQHEKEIATITFEGQEVQVLCSDTIPNAMVGQTNKPRDCFGKDRKRGDRNESEGHAGALRPGRERAARERLLFWFKTGPLPAQRTGQSVSPGDRTLPHPGVYP